MKRNTNPSQVKPNHPFFNKKASQVKSTSQATLNKRIGNNKPSQEGKDKPGDESKYPKRVEGDAVRGNDSETVDSNHIGKGPTHLKNIFS